MNYIGSKKLCLNHIHACINRFCEDLDTKVFCDLFSGTGAIAEFYKDKVAKVIANDIESYSYLLLKQKLLDIEPYDLQKLQENVMKKESLIYEHFAFKRSYFSKSNARIIDGIRLEIEALLQSGDISQKQYEYTLAALVYSADRIANTTGVYGSYLKKMKSMAKMKISLQAVTQVHVAHNNNEVYQEDANELINKISGDILYLDPPYNHRQYGLNYHVLNAIVEYDDSSISGKSGYGDYFRSAFCQSSKVHNALETLIANAKFPLIVMSYSDDGILDTIQIQKIFEKYGRYSVFSFEHPRYRTQRRSKKGQVMEYLHVLEKDAL